MIVAGFDLGRHLSMTVVDVPEDGSQPSLMWTATRYVATCTFAGWKRDDSYRRKPMALRWRRTRRKVRLRRIVRVKKPKRGATGPIFEAWKTTWAMTDEDRRAAWRVVRAVLAWSGVGVVVIETVAKIYIDDRMSRADASSIATSIHEGGGLGRGIEAQAIADGLEVLTPSVQAIRSLVIPGRRVEGAGVDTIGVALEGAILGWSEARASMGGATSRTQDKSHNRDSAAAALWYALKRAAALNPKVAKPRAARTKKAPKTGTVRRHKAPEADPLDAFLEGVAERVTAQHDEARERLRAADVTRVAALDLEAKPDDRILRADGRSRFRTSKRHID